MLYGAFFIEYLTKEVFGMLDNEKPETFQNDDTRMPLPGFDANNSHRKRSDAAPYPWRALMHITLRGNLLQLATRGFDHGQKYRSKRLS